MLTDIALWRTKELSFTVLTVATATWVVLEVYKFVTLACWVVMFVVTSAFLWSNILRLFNKELPNLSGLEISEELVVKMSSSFRSWMEEVIRWIFRVGAGGDWFVFAGTITALWLVSLVGGCFDFLSLLCVGIVVGMSVPLIYAKCEDKIKEFGEKLRMQGKRLYTMFDEKVLGKMKSKICLTKRETSMVVPNVDATEGAIFSELLKSVLHEIKKAKHFNSKRIELTLRRIEAVIFKIEKLSQRFEHLDDIRALFTHQLQQDLDLLCKCAKVQKSDFVWKNCYAKRLEAFEHSLLVWAQANMDLHLCRHSSELFLTFNANRKGVMGGVCDDGIEFGGGCGAQGAFDFLVGLDEALHELRAKLLDGGGEMVVVLSAPGGCGKTTLAKKLCSDEGIKGQYLLCYHFEVAQLHGRIYASVLTHGLSTS